MISVIPFAAAAAVGAEDFAPPISVAPVGAGAWFATKVDPAEAPDPARGTGWTCEIEPRPE